MPEELSGWSGWLPRTVQCLTPIIVYAVLRVVLGLVARVVARRMDGSTLVLRPLLRRAAARLAVLGALLSSFPVVDLLPLGAEREALLGQLITLATIAVGVGVLLIALRVGEHVVLTRHDVQATDNLLARRAHTQVRIIRRTLAFVALLFGLAAALMTFPKVWSVGASLLASAGVAGLIIGLAARPMIENLIAGLQLAFTQPIRLDDVVIIEGEWGRIEEILSTYVVVRIWDERRLIVPFSHFMNKPFQNWTRRSAELLGTVVLSMDYRVPVDEVRAELERLVHGHEMWDGRVCKLQVTDATEQTVQLRALVSAADSSRAWDLRCELRERLIQFLQERHPDSLPRLRAEVAGSGNRAIVEGDGS